MHYDTCFESVINILKTRKKSWSRELIKAFCALNIHKDLPQSVGSMGFLSWCLQWKINVFYKKKKDASKTRKVKKMRYLGGNLLIVNSPLGIFSRCVIAREI